jgi:hypothetical protein
MGGQHVRRISARNERKDTHDQRSKVSHLSNVSTWNYIYLTMKSASPCLINKMKNNILESFDKYHVTLTLKTEAVHTTNTCNRI